MLGCKSLCSTETHQLLACARAVRLLCRALACAQDHHSSALLTPRLSLYDGKVAYTDVRPSRFHPEATTLIMSCLDKGALGAGCGLLPPSGHVGFYHPSAQGAHCQGNWGPWWLCKPLLRLSVIDFPQSGPKFSGSSIPAIEDIVPLPQYGIEGRDHT